MTAWNGRRPVLSGVDMSGPSPVADRKYRRVVQREAFANLCQMPGWMSFHVSDAWPEQLSEHGLSVLVNGRFSSRTVVKSVF